MKVTFEEKELDSFVGRLLARHEKRFQFILERVLQNNCRGDMMHGLGSFPAQRIADEISKADAQFKEKNPEVSWKDYL